MYNWVVSTGSGSSACGRVPFTVYHDCEIVSGTEDVEASKWNTNRLQKLLKKKIRESHPINTVLTVLHEDCLDHIMKKKIQVKRI